MALHCCDAAHLDDVGDLVAQVVGGDWDDEDDPPNDGIDADTMVAGMHVDDGTDGMDGDGLLAGGVELADVLAGMDADADAHGILDGRSRSELSVGHQGKNTSSSLLFSWWLLWELLGAPASADIFDTTSAPSRLPLTMLILSTRFLCPSFSSSPSR